MSASGRVVLPAEALAAIARATGASLSPGALYDVLRRQTARLVKTDAFYLALYDQEHEMLTFVAYHDRGAELPTESLPVGAGPTSWVVRHRKPLLINSPGEGPPGGTFGTEQRSSSAIHVPMLLGERLVGVISAQAYRPGAYGPDDLRILEAIATHAAIALETSRISRLTREAEATALHSLQASHILLELSNDLSAMETVDAAVERGLAAAMKLAGADGAFLAWRLDERPSTVATLGAAGAEAANHEPGERWSGESTIAALMSGKEEHAGVMLESIVANEKGAAESRTSYTIAIRAGSTPVGTLTVSAPASEWIPPGEDVLPVLAAVGDQTAAAILALRGREELERRLLQIDALGRVAHDLARVGDVERTMKRVAQEGMRVFGAERAGVYFLSPDCRIVGTPVTIGISEDYVRLCVANAGQMQIIRKALDSQSVFLHDARQMRNPTMVEAVEREGIASMAALPLNFMGDVIGALVFYHDGLRSYTEEERRLAHAFADQGALAIGKSRLLDQVGRAKEEWESAFDAAGGLAILDAAGRITRGNRAVANIASIEVTSLPGFDLGSVLEPLEEGAPGFDDLLADTGGGSALARSSGGRTFAVTLGPLETGGWIVSLDDVTDELHAEEALRHSETKFRTLFESAPVSMFTLGADRRFQSLNRAALALLGEAPGPGKRLEDFVLPAEQEYVERQFNTRPDGAGRDFILHFRRRDGTVRSAAILWVPLAGEAAATTLVIARDVTYEMELRQRLMHSEKMAALGQLVSGVAHELNNPLAGIMALAQALMPGEGRDEGARRVLESIRTEASRAARIVNDLLTFSRQRPLVLGDLDLNSLVREIGEKIRKTELTRWEMHLAPDLPVVQADVEQIRQVLVNLMTNAEYCMRNQQPGLGTVRTWADEDVVRCAVADSGPGIPQEMATRIFEPFFTTKPAGDGTGLGLSIVHGIIRAHGGQIQARNRAQGGASFVFELPRRITAEPRADNA